ncbi:hypothetical protein MKW92_020539 [Papaver armeniacum]|nr:hypothetical protein MKW92_020539 [Papaver armeniacum]
MILHRISLQFQNPKLHSLYPKRFSSSSISFSKLKVYDFSPPEHLSVKPNSIKPNVYENPKPKRQKPLYRPPSTLDTTDSKPLHSYLPFDFRFSYTESSPDVRPIGLREPIRTGVCAPVVDPIVKYVDDGIEGEVNLEEKRKKLRDYVLGKPLSDAERKNLLDKCQRVRSKRQINLGKLDDLLFHWCAGRDGFTHNILNDIHNNWKTCEAARIRCLGVPEKHVQPTQVKDGFCATLLGCYYGNLVPMVRDEEMGRIDYKEQIVIWRAKNYTPPEPQSLDSLSAMIIHRGRG